MPASYNIKTDFGAVGDGSTDDGQAFIDFNTAARLVTGLVTLTIPAGTYSIQRGIGGFADGIKQLLIVGAGIDVTIIKNDRAGGNNAFAAGCSEGVKYTNADSTTFQTVSAGASAIVVTDPSLFSVNNWVLLCGIDLQGLYSLTSGFGDPPNQQVYEYAKITNISSSTLTLATPLRNAFKSTWPRFNSGDAFHSNNGGPATIHHLNQFWDTEIELRDLTVNNPTNQTSCKGRSVTLTRVKSTSTGNNFALFPGETGTFTATGCVWENGFIEIDKLTETSIFDSTTLYQIQCQSPTGSLTLRNGCTVTNVIQGTTRDTYIYDSTIASLQPGCTSYGSSRSLYVSNCTISAFSDNGSYNHTGTENGGPGLQTLFSMSGGIISVLKSDCANFNHLRWAIPGALCMWVNDQESQTSFRVLDIYEDATKFYVQTTMSGGFPNVPTGGPAKIRMHPCPQLTMINCTGCPEVVDLSQAPAGRPLYSYSRRTYTKADTDGAAKPGAPKMWGNISRITVDVTSAYATGNLTFHYISEFDNWTVVDPDDYSAFSFGLTANVHNAGTTVITPGNGVAKAYWLTGQSSGLGFSSDVHSGGADFSVTITLETDQGFPAAATAVVPLRLRLHS